MKKMMISSVVLAFLLAGCSVEDLTSKSKKFATQAEAFGETIVEVKTTLETLENNRVLSKEDQRVIVGEVDTLIAELNRFEEADAPFAAKAVKKKVMKELNKREKELKQYREKAVKGKASGEDVSEILELLSDDFGISMLGK
jgi:hypothetical protein